MKHPVPGKPVTLHDVARHAGVSTITASRALGNPGVVSRDTIEKVRRAVEATGYIPNLIAGGLKNKRSLLVAALVPDISVAQFLPTVKALTGSLDAAGYQLILGQTGYDHAREEALISTMLGRRPDGMVLTGLVQSATARERLRLAGIPVVETWDLSEQPVDMLVGFSHRQAGAAIARFFEGRGWRRMGIASGDDQRAAVRREGLLATAGRGVPTAIVPAPSSLELGRRALADLLAQDSRLRAVYCSADTLALGVMTEARARGLRVPQDLAICGFGDADFAAHTHPSLTSVQVDGAAIGRMAAQLVIDRCRGIEVAQPVVDVGFRIVDRDSTGAS